MGYPRFGMLDLLKLLGGLLVGLFRSHAAREAETAFLRQQLVVLKRSAPARLRLRTADRLIFVYSGDCRGCWPNTLAAVLRAASRWASLLGARQGFSPCETARMDRPAPRICALPRSTPYNPGTSGGSLPLATFARDRDWSGQFGSWCVGHVR